MLAGNVYNALSGIEQESVIDSSSVSYLTQKGLIESMSLNTYKQKLEETEKTSALSTIERDYNSKYSAYQKSINELSKQLSSKWHVMFESRTKLQKEKNHLLMNQGLQKEILQRLDDIKVEKERLNNQLNTLATYTNVGDAYVKITDSGKSTIKQLKIRLEDSAQMAYDELEKIIKLKHDSITKRYERFKEFEKKVVEKGYEESSKTTDYALLLSKMEGNFETIFDRTKTINDYLLSQKLTSNDRLKILYTVAQQSGVVTVLQNNLKDTVDRMIKNGHLNNYSTWFEAANIIKMKAENTDTRIAKFENVQEELDKRQWSKGKAATCYVAANLMLLDGTPQVLAENFRNIEKNLIETGRTDSIESGVASLVLMNVKGTIKDKVAKFDKAFLKMHDYGFSSSRDTYASSAMLSALPGSIEENISYLDDLITLMKKDGYKYNLLNRATTLLGVAFSDIADSESRKKPDATIDVASDWGSIGSIFDIVNGSVGTTL